MQSSEYARNAWKAGLALGAGLLGRELLARNREDDLSGEVALITGGSRGLGLALARELAGEGCRLAICARDAGELEAAGAELRASGAEVLTLTCDVGNEAEVEAMVASVIAHYGRIDALYAVAGTIEVGSVEDMGADDFRRAMDVMFWGTLHPILAVLPGMRAQGQGRIAAVTSIGGKISVPRLLPYSSAKFAAVGLAEGLAAEAAGDGIRVTTIVPGLMRTGSHVAAEFKGSPSQQEADYWWFSAGASSPIAPRADRAARIIVRAVKRRETERIFPVPLALASRFHGLAPALTIRLMQVAHRILPTAAPDGDVSRQVGGAVEDRLDSTLHAAATTLGREAESAFNQSAGPVDRQS